MKFSWLRIRTAWQPFTFKGVAAFARASFARLFAVQLIVALLAAWTVVWFFDTRWFPAVRQAIQAMPESGEIRNGRLTWTDSTPQLLAEGHYLAFISDLNHSGAIRVPAHIQVELGRTSVRFISLLGYADQLYPADPKWIFLCNRNDLQPWWGAWRPPILWSTFGVVVVGLMIVWGTLATLYCIPVWLIGFFGNRRLSLPGSWRLAGAALMPGAAMVILSVMLYAFGVLDPLQMLLIQTAHFIVGWIYCVAAAFREPKLERSAAEAKNPFTPGGTGADAASAKRKAAEENPFRKPE